MTEAARRARIRDRSAAGSRLAVLLADHATERPLILALPRGGVVVGFEIARALHAPLDVLVARKLGAPSHPEYGVGAIAPGNVRYVDPQAVALSDMTEADLDRVVRRERREMARRELLYRAGRPAPVLVGRTVIIADDGIATGVTARAAVMAVRALGARKVVLAVGVSSPQAAAAIQPTVDDLVSLIIPDDLTAVGLHYEEFAQVTDDEVIDLLARSRA